MSRILERSPQRSSRPPHGDWGIVLLESIGAHATRMLPRQAQAERLAVYQEELRAFATFLRAGAPPRS